MGDDDDDDNSEFAFDLIRAATPKRKNWDVTANIKNKKGVKGLALIVIKKSVEYERIGEA